MRWGLMPFGSKEPETPYGTFNARAETLAKKPAFRAPFRSRRCLIPTSEYSLPAASMEASAASSGVAVGALADTSNRGAGAPSP
jgi:putative SOS response-associated peptidase YedK